MPRIEEANMTTPRDIASEMESHPALPAGDDERFVGYGVMAQPFASGHVLALRRFVATSVGPAYTSIWHRDPDGRWTFRITGEPLLCCNRYFGSAIDETILGDIALEWTSPSQLAIAPADGGLRWTVTMGSTPVTRMLNATGASIPAVLWRQPIAPAMTGAMAGGMLRTGRMSMEGAVPNGQHFRMNPPRIWTITDTEASIDGVDIGPAGPLRVQDRLEDFWLPQRGLFYAGAVHFETYDDTRHRLVPGRTDPLAQPA